VQRAAVDAGDVPLDDQPPRSSSPSAGGITCGSNTSGSFPRWAFSSGSTGAVFQQPADDVVRPDAFASALKLGHGSGGGARDRPTARISSQPAKYRPCTPPAPWPPKTTVLVARGPLPGHVTADEIRHVGLPAAVSRANRRRNGRHGGHRHRRTNSLQVEDFLRGEHRDARRSGSAVVTADDLQLLVLLG